MKRLRPMPDLRIETVPADDLLEYEHNANLHTREQIDQIAASIEQFGFSSPILAWHDDAGRAVVVAGHGRLRAARKLGLERLPVVFIDHMSDEQRRAFGLVENQLTRLSEFDIGMLEEELARIDIDMSEFGFDIFEEKQEVEPIEVQEDKVPEASPTRAHSGDIWRLGEHILACGDSGDGRTVSRIIDREIDLLLADPPYGVDIANVPRPNSRHDGEGLENDELTGERFIDFLAGSLRIAEGHMKPGAAFYVFYAGLNHAQFAESIERCGLEIREQLIWVKSHFVQGRSTDYHWQHEPILYGWKGGAAHYFTDSKAERTVIEDEEVKLSALKKGELIELCERLLGLDSATTVLRADKPSAADLHPTVKPQRLLAQLIRNSSRKGETVYDPFAGSGSTLIACEQMGRKCIAVEIDPHYCDVVIERWETFTGKAAERLSNG